MGSDHDDGPGGARTVSGEGETEGCRRDVERIGSVGHHHASASVCERIGACSSDDVPVLRSNVIAEHVADFDRIKLSDGGQFRNGVQHFFGLEFRFNSPGGVVDLGRDGPAGVDEANTGEVSVCSGCMKFGRGRCGLRGEFLPMLDGLGGVGHVVAVVKFE